MISIVVIIRDNFKISYKCLQSITWAASKNFEVIIVNNGGGAIINNLINIFKAKFEQKHIKVKTIVNENNLGAAVARNQAIALASGNTFVFLDNDVFGKDKYWLKRIQKLMMSNNVAGVGPKLIYPFMPDIIQCAGGGINSKGGVLLIGRGQNKNLAN